MELNLEVCRAIASQNGLPLQFVVKEFQLMDVLGQITEWVHANQETLVFKGGTALSKVYFDKEQRFSEDLDFDSEKDAVPLCKRLARGLRGYTIEEFRKVRSTCQFYCVFQSPLGNRDHVRVDIANKSIHTSQSLQLKPAVSKFTNMSVSGFKVYAFEDLLARKMNALCSRREGKDFYDAHTGLSRCDMALMHPAISMALQSEKRTETPQEFVRQTILNVKKADAKQLQKLTNPFIPLAYRPKNWTELQNDLVMKLENLEEVVGKK